MRRICKREKGTAIKVGGVQRTPPTLIAVLLIFLLTNVAFFDNLESGLRFSKIRLVFCRFNPTAIKSFAASHHLGPGVFYSCMKFLWHLVGALLTEGPTDVVELMPGLRRCEAISVRVLFKESRRTGILSLPNRKDFRDVSAT